ncbi:MAG: ribosome maturation factor RimP [Acetobacteraceae bacterium]|nr:ribosome maturation factor RimP [Acetobacteraceae bacterium]
MARGRVVGLIEELVGPLLKERGLELVGVEVGSQPRGPLLRVYIDREGGVTTADCEWVSERLGLLLDAHDPIPERYYLEVSSPGLERPLMGERDFLRFKGRRAQVTTSVPIEGQRRFTGVLAGVEGKSLLLDVGQGARKAIPLDWVASARLRVDEAELFRGLDRGGGGEGGGR